jgi:hypothetical protein
MTMLIPQIPASVATPLLAAMALVGHADLDPGDELNYPRAITQPTGGLPINDALLKELRESIVAAARQHGFPGSRPNSFLSFELAVAVALAQWPPLWNAEGEPSGEALRNDCWTFITVVVLPDVAQWRWPSKAADDGSRSRSWKGRMLGGSRNAFQRIFRRVMCLDRGADHSDRWGLIRELLEDDFSAILERPRLSSNREVAVCLAEEYLAMKQRLSHFSSDIRMNVSRQATKAICAYDFVQPLDLMSTEGRQHFIQHVFRRYEDTLTKGALPTSNPAASAVIDSASTPASPESAKPIRRSFLRRFLEGG